MTDKQPDALAKKLAKALEFDDFISVKLLRQAATLLRTQHKQIAAYKLLAESQETQLSQHRAQADKCREAIATLQSERDANATLTAEIERKDALLRQALEAFEYPEGANSSAATMSESMRVIANRCADFEPRAALENRA